MIKMSNQVTRNVKNEIRETIKLIREYLRSYSEYIPSKIQEKIRKFSQNDTYRRSLILHKDLGQSLFHNLQLYVRARYAYLEKLIRSGVISTKKPMFSYKVLFEHAQKGLFPVSQPVQVNGITWAALADSLSVIRKLSSLKIPESRLKKRKKLPEPLSYMVKKTIIINAFKDKIVDELFEARGSCSIDHLLSPLYRPISRNSIKFRILALIHLLKNGRVKIEEDEENILVKLI